MSDPLLRFRISAAFCLLGFVGFGGVLGGSALVAEERVRLEFQVAQLASAPNRS